MSSISLKYTIQALIVFSTLLSGIQLHAFGWDSRGQLSGWLGGSEKDEQIGLRYLPELSYSTSTDDEAFIETVVSVHGYVSSYQDEVFNDLDLYRLSFRYATVQSETQIGLQKISFGPAQLLRALRWFDRLDPTDPLNKTEGVYGLRYKYNFINNSNLWLWALYGNEDPKGYELNGTRRGKPEFGGRIQLPLLAGEMALSGHFRDTQDDDRNFSETRMAIDGRWDLLLGLWFEAVAQKSNTSHLEYPWQKLLTVGADFTFPIGNGLHLMAENMYVSVSDDFSSNNQDLSNAAFSISYPVGIFDSFSAIGFYSWQNKEIYQYYNWQRTFDNFALNFTFYSYPSSDALGMLSPYSGNGVQIMFVYNH